MPGAQEVLSVVEVDLGPGVRAGFTTRSGGVSEPPWDALNLGLEVGDATASVLANRELVERWVGARVAFASQVHGTDVRVLAGPPAVSATSVGLYDALVSTSPSVAVAVLVADCVPILLADVQAGVVGAVHAGRRGLVAGVVQAAVDALVHAGAQPSRLRAVVGPSISGAAYEVPEAMRDEVAAVLPETWATTAWGTPALDLPAGVVAVLARAGVQDVRSLGI
ncbi:MAG TPA: polyphenol oxidase family protein, partial [Cellulomonas sp.]